MLRDKNLIPLSHQHQRSLALCVRLNRALAGGEVDVEAWQAEISQQFELETAIHLAAEEKEIFPRAACFPELQDLVRELLAEHAELRGLFSRAQSRSLTREGLGEFEARLAAHIRKEERQLFEAMQKRIGAEEMNAIGTGLERALAEASAACVVPNPATRLIPKLGGG